MPGIPKKPVTNAVAIFIGRYNPIIPPKKLNIRRKINPTMEFNINLNRNFIEMLNSHSTAASAIIPIINHNAPENSITSSPHFYLYEPSPSHRGWSFLFHRPLPAVIHSRSYTISIGVTSGGTFPNEISTILHLMSLLLNLSPYLFLLLFLLWMLFLFSYIRNSSPTCRGWEPSFKFLLKNICFKKHLSTFLCF
ncbi:hypothetical protein SAMN02746089_02133 [Caldanaerobius fijiensis DSM 17918]|uniref:Uncharacterized protein n=1 Tax=Caldanaerobius fijiensis DSM 17918 TaxID=1121256 RepID=A0A1M5CID1_9THEO|nr:hypothetical protein SAMN02746089_02133 [Caldanaerobius fijiensis DSM 17918]